MSGKVASGCASAGGVAPIFVGTWGAIDNVCTHDGGILGEGELDDCMVECPRHGARFDLLSGAVKALPAVFPVNAYPVRIVNGKVQVDLGVATKELEIG